MPVGVDFVCVCGGGGGGGGKGDGRGGDTNYMIRFEDENSVWLCKTEDFLQLRKKKKKCQKCQKKKKKKKKKKEKKIQAGQKKLIMCCGL